MRHVSHSHLIDIIVRSCEDSRVISPEPLFLLLQEIQTPTLPWKVVLEENNNVGRRTLETADGHLDQEDQDKDFDDEFDDDDDDFDAEEDSSSSEDDVILMQTDSHQEAVGKNLLENKKTGSQITITKTDLDNAFSYEFEIKLICHLPCLMLTAFF